MAPNAKEGYGACTVYAIEDLTSGGGEKYPYIGSCAKPLYARWGQHLHDTYYKNSSNIQKLIRTRPWEFRPVILLGPFACADQRTLNTLEQASIRLHKPRCNMRCASRNVDMGLKELIKALVFPAGIPVPLPKVRFRQLTVEESWHSHQERESRALGLASLRTLHAPRCTSGTPAPDALAE